MSALQITFGAILAVAIIIVSWRSLPHPGSHGFWRFWGFSATLYLVIAALPVWIVEPGSLCQIVSFALLFLSLYYVLHGVWLLHRHGGRAERDQSPETLGFERTARLVTRGLYRYVRHPMYGSLIFLSWGCFLKLPAAAGSIATGGIAAGAIAAIAATIFYFVTAKYDERECLDVFGEDYRTYMKRSRMFMPFVV